MSDVPEHLIPVKGGHIPESEFLGYVDITDMKICSECYAPCGFWTYRPEIIDYLPKEWNPTRRYFQKCRSTCTQRNRKPLMHARDRNQAAWPGFDFNERLTLCYACGQELRLSGSRFSYWFCRTCQSRAMHCNSRHTPYIVPLGRHSAMAGFVLPGMEGDDDDKMTDFVENVNLLFRSVGYLEAWRRFVMERNFATLGISGDVRLDSYLANAYNDRLKFEAWGQLCTFMLSRYWEDEAGKGSQVMAFTRKGEA